MVLIKPFHQLNDTIQRSCTEKHHTVLIVSLPCFLISSVPCKFYNCCNKVIQLEGTARIFCCSRRIIIQPISQQCIYLTMLVERGSVDCSVQMQWAAILCLPSLLKKEILVTTKQPKILQKGEENSCWCFLINRRINF